MRFLSRAAGLNVHDGERRRKRLVSSRSFLSYKLKGVSRGGVDTVAPSGDATGSTTSEETDLEEVEDVG